MPRDGSLRIAGYRALALGLGLLVAVTVLELLLRATGAFPAYRNPLRGFHHTHDTLGWVGVPDYSARFSRAEFDVVVESGATGFRKPAHGVQAFEPMAPTVVFLGDSFTWGWGVPQGTVFTDRLQEQLGGEVRIVNRGVSSWGTGQQRLLLEHELLGDRPDVVVVMFFANDLKDNQEAKKGRRPWFELVDGRAVARNVPVRSGITGIFRETVRHSRAVSFLAFNFDAFKARLEADRIRTVRAKAPPDPGQWSLERALLEDMREIALGMGAELRLVYVPPRGDLLTESPTPTAVETRAACEALGIPFLDLTPELREAWRTHADSGPEGAPIYLPLDGHWAPEGHAAAARALADRWTYATP